MIIYYLQLIKRNINSFQNEDIQPADNEMSCKDKEKAEEVMQEKENAYTFIKQLNASCSTVGFVILPEDADCAVFCWMMTLLTSKAVQLH